MILEVDLELLRHYSVDYVNLLSRIHFGGIILKIKNIFEISSELVELVRKLKKPSLIIYFQLDSTLKIGAMNYQKGLEIREKIKLLQVDVIVVTKERYCEDVIYGIKDEEIQLCHPITQERNYHQNDEKSSRFIQLSNLNLESDSPSHLHSHYLGKKIHNTRKYIETKIRPLYGNHTVIVDMDISENSGEGLNSDLMISMGLLSGVDCIKIPIVFKNRKYFTEIEKIFNAIYLKCLKDSQLEYAVTRSSSRLGMFIQEQSLKKNYYENLNCLYDKETLNGNVLYYN